ncbi:MAG: bifunctional 4-hydroxy-2-oxoglutarate aldolase/2-dehydro-3-deoxy-phosphogluconate aldolase [Pseudomonadota bacterium]
MTDILGGARVVPVVVIDQVETAVPLAETLVASGISVIEVTLRTDAAMDAIAAIAKAVPGMVTGAGSVRTPKQMQAVVDAGAQFTVCPGATEQLVAAAERSGVPFFPGGATPSEMLRLYELGFSTQKFFPAEVAGGIPMLKAVSGPLPEVRFMPTGGISVERAVDYLALPNVACVGGSWITPKDLLAAGDFDAIAQLASAAAALGD